MHAFDLIEQLLKKQKEKLGKGKILFLNVKHCCLKDRSEIFEETDEKLVTFVHAAQIPPDQSIMIRSGDSNILDLFLLHSTRLVNICCLVNNGTGKNHKITSNLRL